MSDVSELLILLTKNERMSESLIFLSESLIRSFWTKNERFARKSHERIPSPGLKTSFLCNFCQQFVVYINITTPAVSYAHEQSRKPKMVCKKVHTLKTNTNNSLCSCRCGVCRISPRLRQILS